MRSNKSKKSFRKSNKLRKSVKIRKSKPNMKRVIKNKNKSKKLKGGGVGVEHFGSQFSSADQLSFPDNDNSSGFPEGEWDAGSQDSTSRFVTFEQLYKFFEQLNLKLPTTSVVSDASRVGVSSVNDGYNKFLDEIKDMKQDFGDFKQEVYKMVGDHKVQAHSDRGENIGSRMSGRMWGHSQSK